MSNNSCDFLINNSYNDDIFVPEKFDEEQISYFNSARNFCKTEILNKLKDIDSHSFNKDFMKNLLKKAGEEGFLMSDIPTEYEGLDLNKTTSMLLMEGYSIDGSFATSIGAHSGIGTLPIIWFGNTIQKDKYLLKSATGEYIFAYSLTEPESGSDALSIKTTATLSEDGKYYILNGTKQFVTNGTFADVFITFAKIDKNKFTAFIVEKNFEGITIGKEEDKMGISFSSTTSLILNNCKVPVENLLGEIGKGHKIAFSVLNIGRMKLGFATIAGIKHSLEKSIKYAKERKQFGKYICDFNIIKEKIVDIFIKAFLTESASYRITGNIDKKEQLLNRNDENYFKNYLDIIEEYSIEASISKIYCSEYFNQSIDETLQIFGGYGYIKDYEIEKNYRDSRIYRIFEGTNEINKLFIISTLLKRVFSGKFDTKSYSKSVIVSIKERKYPQIDENNVLGKEICSLERTKMIFFMILNEFIGKFTAVLEEKQDILAIFSDIISNIYMLDSIIQRSLFVQNNNLNNTEYYIYAVQIAVNEKIKYFFEELKKVLTFYLTEEEYKNKLNLLNDIYYLPFINIFELKQKLFEKIKEKEQYFFTIY